MQGIEPLLYGLGWFLWSLVSSVREIREEDDHRHAGEEEDMYLIRVSIVFHEGSAEYQEPPGTLWNGCSGEGLPDAIYLISVLSS